MVDESNNFPAMMIFSQNSSWPEERLTLNLLRLPSARAQLQPAHNATENGPFWPWGVCVENTSKPSRWQDMRVMTAKSKKIDGGTFFAPVGLAFCALRVSIRVDVKCWGQLASSDDPLSRSTRGI
jgi:hypothetical protein